MIPVDFEKTMQTKRLVRPNNHLVSTAYLFGGIGVLGFALYQLASVMINGSFSDIYIYGGGAVVIAVMAYAVYLNTMERYMVTIPSPYSTETNKQVIDKYLQEHEFTIDYAAGDYLIATKPIDFSPTKEMQLTLIFIDGGLLVNVIGNRYDVAAAFDNRWYDTGYILFANTGVRKNILWAIKMWNVPKEQYHEEY